MDMFLKFFHIIWYPMREKSEKLWKKSGNTFQCTRIFPNEAADHDLNKIFEKLPT